MKSISVIIGLFAVAALSAPVSHLKAKKDVGSDAFNYTNNINNAVEAKDVESDTFNYHNNIDNAVTVSDADGTKVILSSPYTDDVDAADRLAVLGE
ncbi:hypothetical protein O1611_g8457 [Lasiodiplodia mahajangana]|uniref:Uncharacterized protein n=1 Tax=Lasiodiplodia mahajangana TaxID=1108764 RepID=A0ACC2JCF3_9PEZI|nr:hypothetical protein O1611_g8457 [Lasiodiplodia mahajangana]